jgi:predicted nucleic acid-binding protein
MIRRFPGTEIIADGDPRRTDRSGLRWNYYSSRRSACARLSLQRVSIEDRAVTERALSWYKGGMDFGDAMIAASSHGSARVATFDRDFARLARKLRTAPPVELALK